MNARANHTATRALSSAARPLTHAAMVAITTLAGLPSITPWRLRRLLWHHPPTDALDLLRAGAELHPMVHRSLAASAIDQLRRESSAARAGDVLERCVRLGIEPVPLSDPRYPPVLSVDREAPVLLFARGDLSALDGRRVAIIGTRNATAAGRATAAELGAHLAEAGVAVVSGLARGIDGAAHHGVRGAGADPVLGRAVAIVANGLDRPYPRQHTDLWRWVGDHGLLLSEWAPGTAPEPWRFPLRNRVIAALAELLVVVESRERGGSMITVDAAMSRSVPVMAVPGSVRSRASDGTNTLIDQGAQSVRSAGDVLLALGLDHRREGRTPFDPRPSPDPFQQSVLDLCGVQPATLDRISTALGCGLADAALAVARLASTGWLHEVGGWFEPTGSRLFWA